MTLPSLYAPGTPGRAAAVAVVRTAEVGRPDGGWDRVSTDPRDPGGLSAYPIQLADKPDTLDEAIKRYIARGGYLGDRLAAHLPALAADRGAQVPELVDLVREAGRDPLMRAVVEELFAARYADPAERYAREDLGLATPAGYAVVLDSWVQGQRWELRQGFPERPPSRGGDETAWLVAYLAARRAWLGRLGLSRTTYRLTTLEALVRRNPGLASPLRVYLDRWVTLERGVDGAWRRAPKSRGAA